MAKRLMVLVGILAVLFVAAVPALAQGAAPEVGPKDATSPAQEGTPRQVGAPKEESEGAVPPGPPPGTFVTLTYELTVGGKPPAGTRFFGSAAGEGGPGVPLTDPDGDGLYTGSVEVSKFPPGPGPPDAQPISLPVRIGQLSTNR